MKATTELIHSAEDLLQQGIQQQDNNRKENAPDFALDVFLRHLGNAVRFSKSLNGSDDLGTIGQPVLKPAVATPATKTTSDAKLQVGQAVKPINQGAFIQDVSREVAELSAAARAEVQELSLQDIESKYTREGLALVIKQINQTAVNPITVDGKAPKTLQAQALYNFLHQPLQAAE